MDGKLPPWPWRVVEDRDGYEAEIVDANGEVVLGIAEKERCPDPVLQCSPEVLRAIVLLPSLIAVARRVLEVKGTNFLDPHVRDMIALEDALALIDGTADEG